MFAYHFYILFILENSNHSQNEEKEICAIGPGTTKILFLKKPSSDFFFFSWNKAVTMQKYDEAGFLKEVFNYAQSEENRGFLARNELFLIFLTHPSLKYLDFLHEVRQSCLLISFTFCLFWKIQVILKIMKKRYAPVGPEQQKHFFLKIYLSDFLDFFHRIR